MGNTESAGATANVLSGLKKAQDTKNNRLYTLVDYKGRGDLSDWMKFALSSGDFNIVDELLAVNLKLFILKNVDKTVNELQAKVSKFLYGGGKGQLVPISDLIKLRNTERNAMLGALRRKKGKGKSGPNIFEGVNQAQMQGDMMKGTYIKCTII